MDGKSLNITDEKLNKLKEIIPEAFTEKKIDWEKLKAALGEDIEFKNERYVLNWAGKSDAFRVLQSPTTATLVPDKDESVNFNTTENVFIEGENLEVLKILQKSYFGKIKMIYIDPPYNTGNDNFIYPDKFSETKEEYLSRIGDKDESGYLTREGLFRKNSKDSGHYHSNWLSMMYPRLFLARNLMRDDGVIFVSIDDNEVHNLRLLMNEVFGEENFFSKIIIRANSRGQTYKQIAKTHEYILVYTKKDETELYEIEKDGETDDLNLKDNIGNFNIRELRNRNPKFGKHNRPNLFYPIYVNPKLEDKDGFYPIDLKQDVKYAVKVLPYNSERKESCWRWGKNKFSENTSEKTLNSTLVAKKKHDGSFGIYEKYRKSTYKPKSIWTNNSFLTETGTVELKQLNFNAEFDFPKPTSLIKQCAALATAENDIILDFFAGSATTAHAVLDLNKEDNGNRKFICVQLPEQCDENSEAYKAGYKTIAEIGKERIRRVIKTLTPDPSPLTRKGEEEEPSLFANPEALSERSVFKYNPKLTERAQEMRKNPTPTEKKLWDEFLKKRPMDYKFLRQKPIGNYILDFYCSKLLLAVEIDGDIHKTRKEYDKERDDFLNGCGIKVIRISNNDVENNFNPVKKAISESIRTISSKVENFPLSRGIEGVGFKVFKLQESNFKIWRTKIDNEEQLVKQIQQHLEPLDENSNIENVLYELLLKSGISLTSKVEEKDDFYLVNDNELALILEKVDNKIIKKVIDVKPQKVITLDRLFKNNDQLKTNTALQMKDAGIEFKVV